MPLVFWYPLPDSSSDQMLQRKVQEIFMYVWDNVLVYFL